MSIKRLRLEDIDISDLSQLQGMQLQNLYILSCTKVKDISPLKGMPLLSLDIRGTPVVDLTPLKGLSLYGLTLWDTKVTDLSPLKGMQLRKLWLGEGITDLSPLKGMPLRSLWLKGSKVSDLSPLAGMPLSKLNLEDCSKVTDVSPLKGMRLTLLYLHVGTVTRGMDVIRDMKTLGGIVDYSRKVVYDHFNLEEFWEKYDAGEFKEGKSAEQGAEGDAVNRAP